MDIEFDTAKDAANIARRGLSLALGRDVLLSMRVTVQDTRHTTEARFVSFAVVEGRALACVYTMRGDVHRIISIRAASRKERQAWLS